MTMATKTLITHQGVPVAYGRSSLTAGMRRPVLRTVSNIIQREEITI
jgi:hypothetical protein